MGEIKERCYFILAEGVKSRTLLFVVTAVDAARAKPLRPDVTKWTKPRRSRGTCQGWRVKAG